MLQKKALINALYKRIVQANISSFIYFYFYCIFSLAQIHHLCNILQNYVVDNNILCVCTIGTLVVR